MHDALHWLAGRLRSSARTLRYSQTLARRVIAACQPAKFRDGETKNASECRPTASVLPVRPGGFGKPLLQLDAVYTACPCSRKRARLELARLCELFVMQQVGSFMGYTGRRANVTATAAHGPEAIRAAWMEIPKASLSNRGRQWLIFFNDVHCKCLIWSAAHVAGIVHDARG